MIYFSILLKNELFFYDAFNIMEFSINLILTHMEHIDFNFKDIFDNIVYYILHCYEPRYEKLWMNLIKKIRILYLNVKHRKKQFKKQLYHNIVHCKQFHKHQKTEFNYFINLYKIQLFFLNN